MTNNQILAAKLEDVIDIITVYNNNNSSEITEQLKSLQSIRAELLK
jgi:hypothetical protein